MSFVYLRESELKEAFDECKAALNLREKKVIDADQLREAITDSYKAKTDYDAFNNSQPEFSTVMKALVKALQLLINSEMVVNAAQGLDKVFEGIHKMQFVESKITAYQNVKFGEVLPVIQAGKASENAYAAAIFGWATQSISIRSREIKAVSIDFINDTLKKLDAIDIEELTKSSASLKFSGDRPKVSFS